MPETFASKLPDTIQTERLILRAPKMADVAPLQQLANNKSIHNYLARLPFPYTDKHALDFVTNLARTKDEHAYAITNYAGEFIGVIGWHLDHEPGPELGYWLGQPYWGKGYATETTVALIRSAADAGYKKLFARSITANQGSLKVLKKAGFTLHTEGIDDCGVHKNLHVSVFQWESDKSEKDDG